MKSCQACKRSVSDDAAVPCGTCGVVSHRECSLGKLTFVDGRPSVQPACDRCFELWMRSLPPLFRVVILAALDAEADAMTRPPFIV